MRHRLSSQDHLFVLTGAGISAESGLPTFAASTDWEGLRVEDVSTPEAFAADPALVWQFYSERRQRHETVQPNPAHFALAELERDLGDRFFLCTQNVDSLHELAGSSRVVHMHGRIMQSRCSRAMCSTAPFDDRNPYRTAAEIPHCEECGAQCVSSAGLRFLSWNGPPAIESASALIFWHFRWWICRQFCGMARRVANYLRRPRGAVEHCVLR
jgi:NAD-dependent SIR2 family protein deacetylase